MLSGNDFIHKERDFPHECYKIFKDMRQKKEFCDITLNLGNYSIYAHKVILAASIPYFRSSFGSNVMEDAREEISLNDVSPIALEALIDFAYTCEVKVTSENVHELLTAACVLRVNCVKKVCIEFLTSVLSPDNAISFRDVGVSLSCVDLINKADFYIKENFDDVSECEGFLYLPYLYMKDLISSDDLNVKSEEQVFEGMMRWIKAQPDERNSELPSLLSCVRMPFLKFQYFRDAVATDQLIKGSLECRDILDDARDYHLFLEKRYNAKNSWRFSTAPRRYKSSKNESKCSVLAQKSALTSEFYFKVPADQETKLSEDETIKLSDFSSGVESWDRMVYGSGSTSSCVPQREWIACDCNSPRSKFEESGKVPFNSQAKFPLIVPDTKNVGFCSGGKHPQGTAVQRCKIGASFSEVTQKNNNNVPLPYTQNNNSTTPLFYTQKNSNICEPYVEKNYDVPCTQKNDIMPLPFVKYHPSIDDAVNKSMKRYMSLTTLMPYMYRY